MVNYRRDIFKVLEAAFVGLFFVQATRFLYGTIFAHVSSASLVSVTTDPASLIGQLGVVDYNTVQLELIVLGCALLLPILFFIFGRLWFGSAVAAIFVAAGRVFMTANGGTTLGVYGAAITVGAGLLYISCVAVRRQSFFPTIFLLGFAGDQLVRLVGNTLDTTWSGSFLTEQTVLSLALFLFAALSAIFERLAQPSDAESKPVYGAINGWGGLAIGGLLYMEFAVLGLPNLLAHRAGVDYASVAPFLIGATLLPLVAVVRGFARQFLAIFDGSYRGYIWFLLLVLLCILGFRFGGGVSAAALVILQLLLCLALWWVVQPSTSRFNFTGIAVIFAALVFLLLTGGDFLTYEYAFIRGIAAPYGDLLRAFRGLGIAVAILSLLLVSLPTILARKRIPWRGGGVIETLAGGTLMIVGVVVAVSLTRPTLVIPPATGTDRLRVATLNLHGGYGLYYGADLQEIGFQIKKSGANIVLLQDVETGRLISYGVDQAAWLARYLNMQVAYYPTNEGLQGLAILSQLPIEAEVGAPLTSINSKQTGVQFVRVKAPDGGTIDVYNTQLSLIFRTETRSIEELEQDQDTQIGEIFSFFQQNGSFNTRLLLGGTFNHTPETKIYLYMGTRNFVDPFAGSPVEKAVTLRRVNNPPARVDYLWLYCPKGSPTQCLTPFGSGTTTLNPSSHNLVVVEVELKQ